MKRYFLLLSLFVGLSSCKKDSFSATKQAAIDDGLIKAYVGTNSITAIKDPSGVYYQIIKAGTGGYPSANATVTVNYNGKLLNGSVFVPPNNFSSPLSALIKGWQIGIPLINTGGRILLIIPSALGYGNSSPDASIPANSVLVFTIDLVSFNN